MKGKHRRKEQQLEGTFTDYETPDEYVRENREILIKVIKHGSDQFVRSLALAALVEYGGKPDREQLKREIDRMER